MDTIPKTTGKRKPLDTAALQGWADKIIGHYERSVAEIIATGDDLLAAKQALGHGRWLHLFDQRTLARPVPFSLRVAQMLMAISKNRILSNTNHTSYLPQSYNTLYVLSRVPEKVLRKALMDGRITPQMERSSAEALRGQPEQPEPIRPQRRLTAQAPTTRIVMQMNTLLWDLEHQLSPDDVEVALVDLEGTIARMRRRQAEARRLSTLDSQSATLADVAAEEEDPPADVG